MRPQPTQLLFLFLFFSLAACTSQKAPFTKKDVARGQKLMGLDFEKKAIDTMYRYLERNRRGYDTLRKYEVSKETFPALTFDPHPAGYQPKVGEVNHVFDIPTDVAMPGNKQELAFYSIPQLASLIRSKKISSVELTQLYIDRIKQYDGQLKSVITITEDLAMEQARKADEEIAAGNYRGILHGIPYGVKDLMAVAGYPTTWGSAPYQNQQIDYTATVVKKLEEQGAVLIAKLVSGALARGDVWFGGKTKNPWDLSQGASGSSAGSGSATAAGLVAFSLGTETLGSIVSPSTRNGVTGLRPTYGRVSRHGVMSLSWSMDKIGPICRSVQDCLIVFDAIYGHDPLDPSTNKAEFSGINRGVKDLKVAYLKKDIDRDTTATGRNLRKALEVFEGMGVTPEAIEMPSKYPYAVFDIILRAEAGAFFDELVLDGGVDTMVEQTQGSRANSLRQSRFIPAVEYLQANRQRRKLIEEVHLLFKEYDVIIAPTFGGRQLFVTNLTGHPALSLPTGFSEKGRPTSLTLLGNLYDEGSILSLAEAYQKATDFHLQQPPLFAAEKMKRSINKIGAIALAVSLFVSACTESKDPQITYNLGSVGAFAEIVNAGVKNLALSSPMSPAEMDEFMPLAADVASRHNVQVYRESDLLVTQLFPADVAEGKEVLLLYQGTTLDTYKQLKAEKVEAAGDPEKERDISRRFGRLLSYSPRKINRLLAENTDYRTLDDFGIQATNVFLYYKDLPGATRFYRDVLGLELLTEYDNASVFLIANGAYLICVDAAKGMHSVDEPKSVALALLTDQLPEWYAHVQANKVPIKYTYKPREGGPHDGFVAIDPEGYLLEFEQFKPHKENEPFADILAQNPRTETAIEADGRKLSFYGAITWLYHKDVLGMQNFWEDVMGLELAADQGWTKIYRATDGGYIGLVDERRGMNNYADEKAVTVSFFMKDLQGWFNYVKRNEPFELRNGQLNRGPDGRYRAFVGFGPEKYFLEFDEFGEHPDNVRLLQTIPQD